MLVVEVEDGSDKLKPRKRVRPNSRSAPLSQAQS